MFKINMEEGGVLFELCLAGLVFLFWIMLIGWTSVLADVLTGGAYRVIVQSAALTLLMLYWDRYRKGK